MGPTLKTLSDMLAAGGTTSRALVEDCLDRMADGHGEGRLTFLKVHAEVARAEADRYDFARREGRTLGPFAGIPLSVKDLFDLRGDVTTAGSTILRDRAPARSDAVAIARLKEAGFIIIGRTNMTEFAFSGLGLNPHYGTPRNPYERNVGRIPGGSSSGAAISVTDLMAHGGIGTDTGGSCRIPAALTGLVGYKPTAVRIPLAGTIPLSTSLDSIGPIARSAHCCQILDAVMAGDPIPELGDAAGVAGLSFAVPQTLMLDELDAHVDRAFRTALDRISAAGAAVSEIPLSELATVPEINAKGGLASAEGYAWHRPLIARHADRYDARVLARFMMGHEQEAADYIDVQLARADLIAAVVKVTSSYDFLLAPTVPKIAPTIASLTPDEEYQRVNRLMLRNPSIVNFLDGCAISLPVHGEGDAPVGLMVIGRHLDDARLLTIAGSIEAAVAA